MAFWRNTQHFSDTADCLQEGLYSHPQTAFMGQWNRLDVLFFNVAHFFYSTPASVVESLCDPLCVFYLSDSIKWEDQSSILPWCCKQTCVTICATLTQRHNIMLYTLLFMTLAVHYSRPEELYDKSLQAQAVWSYVVKGKFCLLKTMYKHLLSLILYKCGCDLHCSLTRPHCPLQSILQWIPVNTTSYHIIRQTIKRPLC